MIITRSRTTVTETELQRKIKEGKAFEVSYRKTGLATDEYLDIYMENPSGSGKTVHIVAVNVRTMAQGHIDLYKGNSGVSGGTTLTPSNLNQKSSNTSSMIVKADPSITTLGTLVRPDVSPGGSSVRAVGSLAEVGEERIIPEDYNILVRATNKSTSSSDIAVSIIWWEE